MNLTFRSTLQLLLVLVLLYSKHLAQLVDLLEAGKLHVAIDPKRFVGIDAVADAVEYLQSGSSSGKVVVQIAKELPPMAASAL